MQILFYRLAVGISCLFMFFISGMLSENEFGKLGEWMIVFIFGPLAIPVAFPVLRTCGSKLMLAGWLIFFIDAAIRGVLRLYFGLRPNPAEIFSTVFNSNIAEVRDFMTGSWQILGQVLLLFLAAMAIAVYAERSLKSRQQPAGLVLKMVCISMLMAFAALHFNPSMRAEQPLLFWPLQYKNYQAQMAEVAAYAAMMRDPAPATEWQVGYSGSPQRTVVLVLGESVNRNNMSLYGYARNTTPGLNALKDELLVFQDVISSAPLTIPSLTKMLSPANLDRPDGWQDLPNVLAIAKHAGYKTYWLSNQVSNDGWVSLTAAQADQSVFINHGSGWGESNFDGNLLLPFERALNDQADKKFIVVHLWGSHFSYNYRYPPEYARFDNDQVTADMARQGRAGWVIRKRNEYDNSILYGDQVISGLIMELKNRGHDTPAALLYVSDHGQEVGHYRDHASHSGSDKSGYEIPMIAWFNSSQEYAGKNSLIGRAYQTDFLDSSLYGLLKISTVYYHAQRDIFSDQFHPKPRTMSGKEYVAEPAPEQ